MNLMWQLVLCGVLISISVLFSASETALVSLSRPRLKKMISQRPALAAALSGWLSAPQYLLTTILVGNTLCNVSVTLLAVEIALALFPNVSRGWIETAAWLVMTLVLFVFADFIPKSLARNYPQLVTLASIRWISALSRAATPVLRVLLGFLDKFPMFEGAPVGRLSEYSLEELREMIHASAAEGDLPRRSTQMMESALRLQSVPVSKIMTPFEHIEAINLGLDPEIVLDQVAEMGHTRVPAYRMSPKKIGGYLHAKDLLFVWRGVLPLKLDALLRRPLYVPPDYLAGSLLEDFRKGISHLAVVTDPAGDCLGLVTLQDILEEIIGEVLEGSGGTRMSAGLYISAFLLCLVVAVFFAAWETALMSMSLSGWERMRRERPTVESTYALWTSNPSLVVAALLLGSTLSSLGAGVAAGNTVTQIMTAYALPPAFEFFLTSLCIGSTILLVGDILPKLYARHAPERVIIQTAWMLAPVIRIFSPFLKGLTALSDGVQRLLTFLPSEPLITTEELHQAVSAHSQGLDPSARRMLTNLIAFHEAQVHEVMIPRNQIIAVGMEHNVERVFEHIVRSGFSRVPVYFGNVDNIVGIVYAKDLLVEWRSSGLLVLEDLLRTPYRIAPDAPLSVLLQAFRQGHHFAVVTDARGRTQGIVTVEDAVEAIVGDIADEFDQPYR